MQAALPEPDPAVPGLDLVQQTGDAVDAAGSHAPVSPVAVSPVAVSPVIGARASGHLERGAALAELILGRTQSSGSQARGMQAGSRLPTERQLSIDLGVTRSSVRNALALLEAQGRISREVGRGTFLREQSEPSREAARGEAAGTAIEATAVEGTAVEGTAIEGTAIQGTAIQGTGIHGAAIQGGAPGKPSGADFAPADVMTIRRLLEPPAMVLVVAWATAADLEEMDNCLGLGDRAATFEEFEACDLALHRCIMAASHSPLLASLYAAIEAARHGQVWGDLKRRRSSPERRHQYQADHRAIVEALRSRDAAAAVEAMRLHLARVQEHLNVSDPAAGLTWR
jgi:GntR family uxuAB operon transcriptional repressor